MKMNQTCKNCSAEFEITDDDLKFYDKVSTTIDGQKLNLPAPTICPDCRAQRRLSFRNERSLYKRKCDLCQRDILSLYKENTSFPVYCPSCWWSDKWNPLDYGQDYNFDKSFFSQFQELLNKTPKVAFLNLDNENSDYNSFTAYCKNTYMSPGSYFLEDCYYCRKSQYSRDCLDCNLIDHCELVKSSTNCKNCYSCHNLLNCNNCSETSYSADCIGCKNCFMCAGLNNKSHCIKNKQYSKEEYEKMLKEYSDKKHQDLLNEFLEFSKTIPKKFQNQINCEKSAGDYIQNCKNSPECYDSFDIEDCKYISECVNIKDSMDQSMHDKDGSYCYEICSGGETNIMLKFSFCCGASNNSEYLYSCFYVNNCFGCDALHSKEKFCILNKQYSEEDYKKMRLKIHEHLINTGEYGEYFPTTISPYEYHETVANEYFPLAENELQKTQNKNQQVEKVPQKIEDTNEEITKKIFNCEKCTKNFRILKEELNLCKRMHLPLSDKCPTCRHLELIALKNPRKLYDRTCAKCQAPIKTTYAPDRPETVYCENCYLKENY